MAKMRYDKTWKTRKGIRPLALADEKNAFPDLAAKWLKENDPKAKKNKGAKNYERKKIKERRHAPAAES